MFISVATQKWEYTKDYVVDSLNILDTALGQVPLYQPWRQLDPGPLCPVDSRYNTLPALTKNDIRENFPSGLLPPDRDLNLGLASGEVQLVETSGTTADKVTNIWNQKWWDASEKASWGLNSIMSRVATGDHREAILVNPKNVGIKSDDFDLSLEQRRLGRFLYLNEKTDPLSWSRELLDRMVHELNIFQPAVLEANPSYLARLSRYISASGQTVFQPGAIVFTYEYPTNFHRRQIRQAFPIVPMISSYGTTETGYVFMQCEAGKFHQNCEFSRVDFQPLKSEHGGPRLGRILVTPLRNPWSYFLRFDTGDIVQMDESGQCACGRTSGMILSAIAGRKVNLTLTCSDRLVTLLELDSVMVRLAGVEAYQLIQATPTTYELHLVSRRMDMERMEDEAVCLLKGLYGAEAEIKVIPELDIAPGVSGKYLASQTSFPIDLSSFLDKKCCAVNS